MHTVIFTSTRDAGRSQMAAAFFNSLANGSSNVRAVAAGTNPAPALHPEVVEAMLEIGIDLRGARPQLLTAGLAADSTMCVSMGFESTCAAVQHLSRETWILPDPKGRTIDEVRRIRDHVLQRVHRLIEREGWTHAAGGARPNPFS